MDATFTLSIKELFIILLGIGLMILIIYLIFFVKNLITALKSANQILVDTQKITAIASERAKDVDNIITDVQESVEQITKNIKGNKSAVGFIGSLISFLTSLKGFMSKHKSKDSKSNSKTKENEK